MILFPPTLFDKAKIYSPACLKEIYRMHFVRCIS